MVTQIAKRMIILVLMHTMKYPLQGSACFDRKIRSQNSEFRSLITIGDRIETENFRSQKPWSQTRNRDQNLSIWSLLATDQLGR